MESLISHNFFPASREFLHVTSTPQTSTSAKKSEQETGKWCLVYFHSLIFPHI